jgi:hypothetical protein
MIVSGASYVLASFIIYSAFDVTPEEAIMEITRNRFHPTVMVGIIRPENALSLSLSAILLKPRLSDS